MVAAQREAMADGKVDMPTFRAWLESWRLSRLWPKMDELGAYAQVRQPLSLCIYCGPLISLLRLLLQQDLLDLELNEYNLLKMKPLEAKRFEQAMQALAEEFLSPQVGSAVDDATEQ